jgi:PAS domain S-box-containing protein
LTTPVSAARRVARIPRRPSGVSAAVVAGCAAAIGFIWIAVVAQARFEQREAIAAAIERNSNLAIAFEEFTVRTIDGADAVARYVRHAYRQSGDRFDIHSLIADRTIDAETFAAISIVDERGSLVATSFEQVPGGPLTAADRPHFTVHVPRDTGKVFVGQPIISRLTGQSTIPISLRINKPDGAFGGIVSVQVKPAQFTRFYGDATLRPGDVITLVGLDGITRARRAGRHESSGESLEGSPLLADQKRGAAVGAYRIVGRLDGVLRYYSYRTLRDYPLMVAVGVAEHDVLLASSQRRARNYLGAGVVSALTALFGMLLIVVLERRKRTVVQLERTMRDLKAVHGRLAEQASLLDKAQDAIIVRDLNHRITYWNKSAERIYGWSASEVLGTNARDLQPDGTTFDEAMRALVEHGDWVGELTQTRKGGRPLIVESRWTLVTDDDGAATGVLVINTDITERKTLEHQFLRAQRLESIGTLAGGIAHDLNNVLTPIAVSIDMLRDGERDPERLKILATLESSARRGADMVRQVLSFARGVEGRRVSVRVADVLRDVERIVNDTFLKNIDVTTSVPPDLWPVRGDPIQLHQVLLNLCVNARDAMPHGGRLMLSAENVTVDAAEAAATLEATAGSYVVLRVQDTGTGIAPNVLDRMFEPFFTTKDVSKGTGLGLSTSLAIVKSHGGFIRVDTAVGSGATFSVYLPADAAAHLDPAHPPAAELPRGDGELILVVDDEAPVRDVTRRMLETYGYRVAVASGGAEAIDIYSQQKDEIAAVITDVMMPIMDGPATIRELRRRRPDVRIIAASGVHGRGSGPEAVSAIPGVHFLPKPYTAATLLAALRRALSGSGEGTS